MQRAIRAIEPISKPKGFFQLTWILRKDRKFRLFHPQLTLAPSRHPSLRSDTRDLHGKPRCLNPLFATLSALLAYPASFWTKRKTKSRFAFCPAGIGLWVRLLVGLGNFPR
jgi:hypothetical protein